MEKQKQIQIQTPLQFTEAELAAAEQLIHLSESSGGATSACSVSSSARSVNKASPQPQVGAIADVADDDECLWRRNKYKRYRSISDLYASSSAARIGSGSGKKENKKRKE